MEQRHTTAVIVGGSMAGSMAAQTVSKYFDRVIVLERDADLSTVEARRGVPQYRQPHLLLLKALSVLESLWPGFRQQLVDAGAVPLDIGSDFVFHYQGDWVQPYMWGGSSGCLGASRALVETVVQQNLKENPKVQFRQGAVVTGYLHSASQNCITGVMLKDGEMVLADLVIDAAGRSSKAPDWLQELGYGKVPEKSINAKSVYATVTVRPPPDTPVKLLSGFNPPYHAVCTPVEGGLYQIILSGPNPPVTTRDSYIEWAATRMVHPYIADFLASSEFVTEPSLYARTGNVLRQYDQCPDLPDGLVIVGDAVAALNPIYGQGISCSSIAAQTLGQVLQQRTHGRTDAQAVRDALRGMSKAFHGQLAQALFFPWTMATSQDAKAVPEHTKTRSIFAKMVDQYIDDFMMVSREHPDMHRTVNKVLHMVAPPAVLLSPTFVYRVLSAPKPWRSNKVPRAPRPAQPTPAPHFNFVG